MTGRGDLEHSVLNPPAAYENRFTSTFPNKNEKKVKNKITLSHLLAQPYWSPETSSYTRLQEFHIIEQKNKNQKTFT